MANDDDISPLLSPKVVRIMRLFKQHGHDMDALLTTHPEITPADVAQVTAEVAAAMSFFTLPERRARRKQPRSSKRGGAAAMQLKITLRGSKPPIWRRVVVPGSITLDRLHEVIQTAMGWYNCHLHAFEVQGEQYTGAGPDGYEMEDGGLEESEYQLIDVAGAEKLKFRYEYDFGDGWEHTVLVEKIVPASDKPAGPVCLAGKGRCPPEDSGGIWGYSHLLEVLSDPSHEDHKDMKEWVRADIDPAAFDIDAVNDRLRHIRA